MLSTDVSDSPAGPTFCLLIGSSKSGTTSLYQYLIEHAAISPCAEKEPNFFASDDHWEQDWDWYRSLWPEDAGPVLLEATTLYTWYPLLPNAATRIKDVADERDCDFRFLYVMRDPIERAESHVTFSATRGHVYPDDPVGNPWLMEVSRYAKQLDQYADRFGRDRLYLLTLEDLQDDPQRELRSICSFLNVSPDYDFDAGQAHNRTEGKTVNSSLWNWLRDFGGLRSLVRCIPIEYRGVIRDWFNPTVDENFQLTADQRRRFIDALSGDLQRLETVYEVDTSSWNLSP
jgi:hypothetical protein